MDVTLLWGKQALIYHRIVECFGLERTLEMIYLFWPFSFLFDKKCNLLFALEKLVSLRKKLQLLSFIFPTINQREKGCNSEINANDLGKENVIIMIPNIKLMHNY